MSTGWIIALIVIVAAVVIVAAAVTGLRARGGGRTGGAALRRRFGPEYDRAVARHDGDAKAAERELAGRLERHGDLREQPLEPERRQQFEARWAAAQERFVDSPRDAVTEADRLLAEVAGARGFPDGGQYEEQLAALSVHHARHVNGYRRVHRIAHTPLGGTHEERAAEAREGGAATEEMREAMVEARALFEDLMAPTRQDRHTTRTTDRSAGRDTGDRRAPAHAGGRAHLPWAFGRRHESHPKGS
ncbi:hypothetical protein [Streptomyces sp. B93]|uniref:hypothetical protein n=1 Tax=Streptomyces sp. B93 TaxID=2824875 RepID=UPI001B3943FF|nr:hypothetical protein [Streptomyces sp. B93]MBQ1094155.1 hypothetical protein [Streptomyces sp. B93]